MYERSCVCASGDSELDTKDITLHPTSTISSYYKTGVLASNHLFSNLPPRAKNQMYNF